MATSSFQVLAGADLTPGGLAQADWFRAERLTKVFVHIVIIAHSGAGKTNQLPPHHIDVPAMHRIAEHAFDGVLPEERKKQTGFDLLQLLVLLSRFQAIEALQPLESLAIDLPGRRFALMAELRGSILFKRPLGVAMEVSSPGSS